MASVEEKLRILEKRVTRLEKVLETKAPAKVTTIGRKLSMPKLIIEGDEGCRVEVEIDESICERLWTFEKKVWRGKRQSSVDSWDTAAPNRHRRLLEAEQVHTHSVLRCLHPQG